MGVGTGQGRVQSQACCWRDQGLGAPQPRGSVRLRGCAQIPLQGWGDRGHTNLEIHNTGVQSCTWSYSFTWAALGMSHTSAGTRPRSCAVGQELAAPAFCGARASLAPAGCEAGPAEQGAPEIERGTKNLSSTTALPSQQELQLGQGRDTTCPHQHLWANVPNLCPGLEKADGNSPAQPLCFNRNSSPLPGTGAGQDCAAPASTGTGHSQHRATQN